MIAAVTRFKKEADKKALSSTLAHTEALQKLSILDDRLKAATERVGFCSSLVSFKDIVVRNSMAAIEMEKRLVTLEASSNTTNDDNTCLLYTSPSPRDRTRSRMPSSA